MGDIADYAEAIAVSKTSEARPKIDIPKLIELNQDRRLLLDELVVEWCPLGATNEAFALVKWGKALRNVIVL